MELHGKSVKKTFDVVVIGSGFGGSVSALRLKEKGYSVAVLEAGKRFRDKDFPKTSWRISKFLFAPKLGLYGIQRIHVLPDVLVLAGAGVGGGSLVYANTLYQPGDQYFTDKQWASITNWKEELEPWYDQARRMLGVTENPYFSNSDKAMKEAAEAMGVGHTFKMAPLGIYFGDGKGVASKDPFFGGVGPDRNGTKIEKLDNGEWKITTRKTDDWLGHKGNVFFAKEVIIAAGTFNTQKLLHKMKDDQVLPAISDRLGDLSRTNSEALTGALMQNTDIDYSDGSAITSSFFPDENTHIEPVRYGKGSNLMGLLQTIMTDGYSSEDRRKQWWKQFVANPKLLLKILNVRRWSERTVIALTMQNVDSSVSVRGKKSIFGWHLTSTNDPEHPNATYIPAANEAVRHIAQKHGGIAGGHVGDLIDAPFTAHFVGGCVIGSNQSQGVIDPYHRVWNYPTLHIVDGSTITANLGVNPSLTITAQAERALSFWPNKGDVDSRPAQDQPYKRLNAVAPRAPFVPAGALGELRVN